MLLIFGSTGGIGRGLMACSPSGFGGTRPVTRKDCNFSDEGSIRRFFLNLESEHDPYDPLYVINAVGTVDPEPVKRLTMKSIEKSLSVDLCGTFLLAKHFLGYCSKRPGSSMVLLSSVVAANGVAGASVYGAVKAGVQGFVRSAAREFTSKGCRINAIQMGYFDSGMIEKVPNEIVNHVVSRTGRLGVAEDLWYGCKFLLECKYMNGAILRLDGGL